MEAGNLQKIQAILSYLPLHSASSRSCQSVAAPISPSTSSQSYQSVTDPLSPRQIPLPEDSPNSQNPNLHSPEHQNPDEEHLVKASKTFQQFGNHQAVTKGRMPHSLATFHTELPSILANTPHPGTLLQSPCPSPSHPLIYKSIQVHLEELPSPHTNSQAQENMW